MTELKTKKTGASVEKFIAGITDEQKRKDAEAICRLMQEATGEPPKMWGDSIIGFGNVHVKYASGRELDWMLAGFSPRKASLTLYIMTGFDEYADASGYDPKPLLDRLGKYGTGKSCLYIKQLSDVDESVLKQLVRESAEQMRKASNG